MDSNDNPLTNEILETCVSIRNAYIKDSNIPNLGMRYDYNRKFLTLVSKLLILSKHIENKDIRIAFESINIKNNPSYTDLEILRLEILAPISLFEQYHKEGNIDQILSKNNTQIERIIGLCKRVADFYFHASPDDSAGMEAEMFRFKDLIIRLKLSIKGIRNNDFKDEIQKYNIDTENFSETFSDFLHIRALCENFIENPDIEFREIQQNNSKNNFISPRIIENLELLESNIFDISYLIGLCNEINDNWDKGNTISVSLLIRTLMNHVPPIYGKNNFSQVANNSGKSKKKMFLLLEENLKNISDYNAHRQISKHASIPTENTLIPFQPNIEFLINDIIEILLES